MLVEDDAAVRRSLQLLLTARGYEVRSYPTATGLASDPIALQADCLIADLILPGTNALALYQELRSAGWQGKSILISGHLSDNWTSRALEKGFDAVLAKPLDDGTLIRCIGQLTDSATR